MLLGGDFADVMKASNHLTLQQGYCPGSESYPMITESGKSESIVARGICEKFSMAGFGGGGDHVVSSDDQPGNEASVVQIEGTECCQPPE